MQRSPPSSLRPKNSEAQRCGQAMIDDADAAGAVAKRDQLLAEQHQAHGAPSAITSLDIAAGIQ